MYNAMMGVYANQAGVLGPFNGHPTLTNNIVSYWKSDDNGSYPDATPSGNDGTINGATFTASGKINGAYDFDGVNDDIDTADIDLGISGDPFSINVWFKHDESGTASRVIMQKGTAGSNNDIPYMIAVRQSGGQLKISIIIGTGSSSFQAFGTTTLTQGQFYMATLVRSGTSYKVFLDGDTSTPEIDTTSSLSPQDTADDLCIGRGFAFFKGTIDEPAVWDKALSNSEVSDLYNSGSGLQY